jgi:aminoglycoside phosphotransferase (APT) family kinase protein
MTQPPSPETIEQLAASVLPHLQVLAVERVAQGVSTYVYRLHCGDTRYYLRVLPEEGASFPPEAYVLERLHEQGVSVPHVVYFAHCEPSLGQSVLVTTEIPGRALAEVGVGEHTTAVLFEAGRMLAAINSLPVAGFGWVARDEEHVSALRAEHSTFRAFALENLDGHLHTLEAFVLTPGEVGQLRRLLRRYDTWLDPAQAVLVHGDFDVTPIFQHGQHCGGIIDFGEIRGAHQWYDLGHFHYHDGETLPGPLLPWLLAGYRTVIALPDDVLQRIAFAALLIGQRSLARLLQHHGTAPRVAPYVAAGVAALRRDMTLLTT